MENYLEETSEGKGGFWLNWYYRILAEGRAKWSDITGKIGEYGTQSKIEGDHILRVRYSS